MDDEQMDMMRDGVNTTLSFLFRGRIGQKENKKVPTMINSWEEYYLLESCITMDLPKFESKKNIEFHIRERVQEEAEGVNKGQEHQDRIPYKNFKGDNIAEFFENINYCCLIEEFYPRYNLFKLSSLDCYYRYNDRGYVFPVGDTNNTLDCILLDVIVPFGGVGKRSTSIKSNGKYYFAPNYCIYDSGRFGGRSRIEKIKADWHCPIEEFYPRYKLFKFSSCYHYYSYDNRGRAFSVGDRENTLYYILSDMVIPVW